LPSEQKNGALLVDYGADYVVDGSRKAIRDELASAGPLPVYGVTKFKGENPITANGCRHVILRTSWVNAVRSHNFNKVMLRLTGERETLSVIDDQIGAPTGAALLVDVSAHVIRSFSADSGEQCGSRCVAKGETTWFGFVRFVIEWA
jgi:dTDP-4-dehydrorhamnose reductase